ncbi:MAG: hypothetical protein GXP49_09425 [Deltaproteobacteria bacterium]|nr:hypothetical protein [Deltaproteobacteria bacterium]
MSMIKEYIVTEEEIREMRRFIHDVRSPLITIRGFAEILKMRLDGRADNNELGFLDKIINNVDKMAERLDHLYEKVIDLGQND